MAMIGDGVHAGLLDVMHDRGEAQAAGAEQLAQQRRGHGPGEGEEAGPLLGGMHRPGTGAQHQPEPGMVAGRRVAGCGLGAPQQLEEGRVRRPGAHQLDRHPGRREGADGADDQPAAGGVELVEPVRHDARAPRRRLEEAGEGGNQVPVQAGEMGEAPVAAGAQCRRLRPRHGFDPGRHGRLVPRRTRLPAGLRSGPRRAGAAAR